MVEISLSDRSLLLLSRSPCMVAASVALRTQATVEVV